MKIVPLLILTSIMAMLATGCNSTNADKEATNTEIPNIENASTATAPVAVSTVPQATETAPITEPEPKTVEAEATGEMLHEAHCTSCHGTEVYTRTDRKVSSYAQLVSQVARCDANIGSQLFEEDQTKIANYLNDNFYKFEK